MKIYIAGAYTKGDVAVNVRDAIIAGDAVAELGHIPFIPHLSHFWHLVSPHNYDFWMEQDLVWLGECNALLRLEGESAGADIEEQYARDILNIPIYYSIAEVPEME